ncbi:MAG TPA: peptidoglycan-binding domain-containing protein [Reyranella sp.]|nr:peptidoglycan-binding domain-containing protein [Reyranella sp.]
MRLVIGLLLLLPVAAFAQSAGTVEQCFQNPAACPSGAPPAPQPSSAPPPVAARPAMAPDYTSVLQKPEPERRRLQESLRTLDKYSGPIDGNLQSEETQKAITEWQKSHGYTQVGKLTPTEAVTLNNEAARAPIKRVNPSTLATATPAPSHTDRLKELQARLAERRKAAEPKAKAATDALVADLKAYVAADGKGVAGDQFPVFAKWYADNKSANRTIGDIASSVDDYGDGKSGSAATAEVTFQTRQGDTAYPQCLVFAWIDATPRKDTQAFACDDVAGVEKWKSEQALKSAWR